MSNYGLPDDVLERAAAQCRKSLVYDREQLVRFVIKPALPILMPAIETATLADTQRRIKAWICQRATQQPSDAYNEGYQNALNDLWEYLPAATEGADHE